MKEILITNDDGYESIGLKKLVKMLKKEFKAKTTIVAPASEKSACSHSITLTKPLKFIKVAKRFYKLDDGTPADCIYLALHALYKTRLPDLIISGINKGANIGEDITYSGTCAGAMEGVLQGIPSIALSQFYKKNENIEKLNFDNALKITKYLIKKIEKSGFPLGEKEFLNVNFPSPKTEFKGMKVCKVAKRVYNYKASSNINPRGVEYFWLCVADFDFEPDKNCDLALLKKGYATITPIMLDLTAYQRLKEVSLWLKGDKNV
ncbi:MULTISPECIES: 5'/3'-nucleotidase SurE [unclassified Campylobacter]|uniref:5'/3'-nucleotidase SurE n=1 Tax=unclassified Campylobacter TaxID=2593542 RepID=UPI001237E8EB|nr:MULTISPECIES: 5'/3'-nucleotidase SurE [unclassified Campylobacter]KAA6227345.1 5'/3'-nucleotidase SurE [Campylobacter sp. LR286c]KAA6227968.1 5'/3'-nucleotidase SurE [Campylobacter sp. LR185c]KAA6228378.1 5'/3'-nucleotidase SurE [Campylobacter sp. LR196d]KAA6229379.1 5'/3'-nucleotidase SurE [Campylobacter sp. LR291e]KAA6231184.1 5'/3'-nucleotidase SurE [Campylobacter sp. LR264d]